MHRLSIPKFMSAAVQMGGPDQRQPAPGQTTLVDSPEHLSVISITKSDPIVASAKVRHVLRSDCVYV